MKKKYGKYLPLGLLMTSVTSQSWGAALTPQQAALSGAELKRSFAQKITTAQEAQKIADDMIVLLKEINTTTFPPLSMVTNLKTDISSFIPKYQMAKTLVAIAQDAIKQLDGHPSEIDKVNKVLQPIITRLAPYKNTRVEVASQQEAKIQSQFVAQPIESIHIPTSAEIEQQMARPGSWENLAQQNRQIEASVRKIVSDILSQLEVPSRLPALSVVEGMASLLPLLPEYARLNNLVQKAQDAIRQLSSLGNYPQEIAAINKALKVVTDTLAIYKNSRLEQEAKTEREWAELTEAQQKIQETEWQRFEDANRRIAQLSTGQPQTSTSELAFAAPSSFYTKPSQPTPTPTTTSSSSSSTTLLSQLPPRETTPSPIFDAIKNNNLPAVETLIKSGINLEQRAESIPFTPLLYAVTRNNPNPQIVQALIRAGANVNTPLHEGNMTPLMSAAGNNNVQIVKLLLDAGANIDTVITSSANQLNQGKKAEQFANNPEIKQLFADKRAQKAAQEAKAAAQSIPTPTTTSSSSSSTSAVTTLSSTAAPVKSALIPEQRQLLDSILADDLPRVQALLKNDSVKKRINNTLQGVNHASLLTAAIENNNKPNQINIIKALVGAGADLYSPPSALS